MTLSSIGRRLRPLAMKWLITPFCLAVFIAGHASVKEEASAQAGVLTPLKVFADLPLEVSEMLRPSVRLDMIDYYNQADSLVAVANALGGESRIEQVASDYMRVAVSPVSTLEIKLLPIGKAQVVMTLYTVGDPEAARDTEVSFFDADMAPLDPAKFLRTPNLTDFFALKGSDVSERELKEKVPYMAVEYSVGPGEASLKAKLTTLRVISEEDRDLLSPLLLPSLSAPWKGKFSFK